jgi:hypothetical protein
LSNNQFSVDAHLSKRGQSLKSFHNENGGNDAQTALPELPRKHRRLFRLLPAAMA